MAYDLTSMKILHSSGNRPNSRCLFAVYLKLQGFTISCFFVVNCSMAVDANHCSVVYTEEYCQLYSNVPYECPNMCKVCPCKCLTAVLMMWGVGVKSLVDAADNILELFPTSFIAFGVCQMVRLYEARLLIAMQKCYRKMDFL